VITGDPGFHNRYEERKRLLPATLSDLERLLIRNRGQQERLSRLRNLIEQQFSEFDAAIKTRSTQGFAAAQTLIDGQARRRETDLVRALVSEMDSVEERLLKERAAHVAASERRILLVGATTATVSVAVRVYLAMRAARTKPDIS